MIQVQNGEHQMHRVLIKPPNVMHNRLNIAHHLVLLSLQQKAYGKDYGVNYLGAHLQLLAVKNATTFSLLLGVFARSLSIAILSAEKRVG